MNKTPLLNQIWRESGWPGLIIKFLISDGSFSAFVSLFKGILAGGNPSLENALTMMNVFLQTFGLSLGLAFCFYTYFKSHFTHLTPYAFILFVTAFSANAIGVGGRILLPVFGNPVNMIGTILAAYLTLYGFFLFLASILIGYYFGRWAYLISIN
jgi:hypothetical protein